MTASPCTGPVVAAATRSARGVDPGVDPGVDAGRFDIAGLDIGGRSGVRTVCRDENVRRVS